jgi:hypothetical protein
LKALEPNRVLHQDYLKNCRARLADGKLINRCRDLNELTLANDGKG